VKMLLFTRGGFTIVHKRLERGRFMFAAGLSPEAKSIEIQAHELAMLLEGLETSPRRAASRWDPPLYAHAASAARS